MRRARILLSMLTCFALATPALATPVTVLITGTWDAVTDDANVLDTSVVVGGSFTATLVYDDSVSDSNSDPDVGDYDISAANSDLSLTTGNYSFVPASGLGISIERDNDFGEDVVFLFAETYTGSGPLPPGITFAGTRFANPVLTDTTGTALSSDDLTDVPWSIGAYDFPTFLFVMNLAGTEEPGQFIQLDGTITGLEVPEPSTLFLGLAAFGGLVAFSRRV